MLLVPIRSARLRLTTELLVPMVCSITPLHGPHGKRSLYCWGLLTERSHSNSHGADRIENAVLLLLPCVYSVVWCLTVSYLATLWPSTLQYILKHSVNSCGTCIVRMCCQCMAARECSFMLIKLYLLATLWTKWHSAFLISLQIAKTKKPFSVGESLIIP
jgi:hypothetical protein